MSNPAVHAKSEASRKSKFPSLYPPLPLYLPKSMLMLCLCLWARTRKVHCGSRDDLSRAAEGRALASNTAEAIMQFFWEQIYCRYGAVGQIITDNGSEFKGVFKLLHE